METHIRHLDDIKLGQGIEVRTQLIAQSAKKMHLFHFMYNRETGDLIATGEHMLLHVNINAGKTCPATDTVQAKLTAVFNSHADLPVPEGAGNAIGQK